jgi:hypothetical protein
MARPEGVEVVEPLLVQEQIDALGVEVCEEGQEVREGPTKRCP